MTLVKSTIQADILDILESNCPDPTTGQQAQMNDFAAKLATAIDTYIKTGTVTGTCATPSGAGTIAGTIS